MKLPSVAATCILTSALLNVSSANAQSADCGSIKATTARLACYDENSKAKAQTGAISGTITWQYNKFVGTRGDGEARIVLIKWPLDETFAKLKPSDTSGLGLGLVFDKPGLIFATKADGFGKFSRDAIPTGYYYSVVVSENTRPAPDDGLTKFCVEELRKYIPDLKFFQKADCSIVKIEPERTTSINHDFGNTYF